MRKLFSRFGGSLQGRITLSIFVVLLKFYNWPSRSGAFNVWVNLPTFDPTAGGDVVDRLDRDARINIALGFLLPFLIPEGDLPFANGDYLFIPDVRKAVEEKWDSITAYKVGEELTPFTLALGELTDDEREIILKGCLINYYRSEK